MFKRVLRRIGRAFSSDKAKVKVKSKGSGKDGGKAETAAERYRTLRDAEVPLVANAPPEKLCGITKGMSAEEIEKQLTQLYRRHNRAASSLDPKLREEAEVMLDAIVEMRLKYLAPADAKG